VKQDDIILSCYRELYAAIGVDFNELMETSPVEDGEIQIPFRDYKIDKSVAQEIIDRHAKKFEPYLRHRFKTTIHLGCSPQFK
jgi:hypothetical protein